MGWQTLDVGEQALIYSKDGSARVEEGPKRMYLFREKLVHMNKYSASQKEYLQINYKTGKIEHRKGPCFEYFNEINHIRISVENLISLDANEALIVYTQDVTSNKVTRRVQYGPTLFMPGENEWLHTFSWHGTDPDNKTRMIKDGNKFSRLKIIPDQFYYNVDEVRTKDDALMRVKLMLFYELVDIERMLVSTVDPMADFVKELFDKIHSCLHADTIAFAAKYTQEEFIDSATELNHTKNYPQLMERCQQIGYHVSKVVFRGYFAHDKLQNMHDYMVKKRAELKLEFEKEVQRQELTDLKLQADVDRMEQEHEMELKQLMHEQKMKRLALEHQLRLEKESHEKTMMKRRQENQAKLNAEIATDELETKHLTDLHTLNVDINDLLEKRSGRPQSVTNIIAKSGAAHVYLHHGNQPTDAVLGTSKTT